MNIQTIHALLGGQGHVDVEPIIAACKEHDRELLAERLAEGKNKIIKTPTYCTHKPTLSAKMKEHDNG